MQSRFSKPFADDDSDNPGFFAVDDIQIELWREFPFTHFEGLFAADARQEFRAVIRVHQSRRNIEFQWPSVISEWHGDEPEVEITPDVLDDRANTEGPIDPPFVLQATRELLFAPFKGPAEEDPEHVRMKTVSR